MGRRFNWQAREEPFSSHTQDRPADFPVGSLKSRAAARALMLQQQQRIQLIFYIEGKSLSLETSSCNRQIWPNGSLFELVMLDGRAADLTDAHLEAFIELHPVVNNERNAHEWSKE